MFFRLGISSTLRLYRLAPVAADHGFDVGQYSLSFHAEVGERLPDFDEESLTINELDEWNAAGGIVCSRKCHHSVRARNERIAEQGDLSVGVVHDGEIEGNPGGQVIPNLSPHGLRRLQVGIRLGNA